MATVIRSSSRSIASGSRVRAAADQPCSFHKVARLRSAVVCPSMVPAIRAQQSRPVAVTAIPVSGPGAPSSPNTPGAAAGQVTSELMQSMRAKICEALETDTCTVTDVYGDGRHVSIDVVSKLFQDKGSMQRQRMVYKAIWLELQEAVHAVDSMSTKTPEEVSQ